MTARFRPDIEGLRTIAILAVVLYHAGVPAVSGGFIGVDLFFVLSGFLITGLLLRELESTGHIQLREFWARRARRLLPAAAVVLVLTAIVSWFVLPITERQQTAVAIASATLYAANWYFASNSLDYLNAEDAPSPVLHFWSLGVEEQFYIVWPIALLLIALALRRLRVPFRLGFGVLAGLVWLVSFGASLAYTETSQPIAFFSSPTRFWQLATGALLAILTPWLLRQSRTLGAALQGTGLVLILYAALSLGDLIERGNAYPGTLALIPTAASALLVAGGTRSDERVTTIERVLNTRLFQWLGGMSYSWYLWHWPVLVLWQAHFGATSVEVNLLLMQGALALAWLTHQAIENPIRFAPALRTRPEASLGIGATFMAATLAASSLLSLGDAVHSESVTNRTFTPLPSAARADVSKVYAANCVVQYRETVQPECIFGDVTANKRMVLLGDSHAASVFPAIDSAAQSLGYRLDTRIKLGCTAATVQQWHFKFNNPFKACTEWRQAQLADLARNPADVVVVVNANNPTPPVFDPKVGARLEPSAGRVAWIRGYAETLRTLRDAGSRVIVLRDNPRVPGNIADCVAMNLTNPSACDFERAFGLPEPAADVLAVRAVPGVRKIDVSDAICDRRTCFAVRDGILAWQRGNHYTATFARSLSETMTTKLRIILNVQQ